MIPYGGARQAENAIAPASRRKSLKTSALTLWGWNHLTKRLSVSRLPAFISLLRFNFPSAFFDGHTFEAAWENKRKMPKHTEQRKQHMREVMIQKWREKCGESNDYTGDDKPVHGNADQ